MELEDFVPETEETEEGRELAEVLQAEQVRMREKIYGTAHERTRLMMMMATRATNSVLRNVAVTCKCGRWKITDADFVVLFEHKMYWAAANGPLSRACKAEERGTSFQTR